MKDLFRISSHRFTGKGTECIFVFSFGDPLEDFCDTNLCVPLDEDKRQNILGQKHIHVNYGNKRMNCY